MHAYLILAHKQDSTLKNLISVIDDERNEIFVHLDKKSGPIQQEIFQTQKSKLHFVPRIRIAWGGYSLVKAELSVLTAAVNTGKYDYYHLLSGEDLPLKTQDEIHAFFEENAGQEFVSFNETFTFDYRANYYYPFQKKLRRGELGRRLNGLCQEVQKLLKIKRNSKIDFYSGSNWFSITNDFARALVSADKWIKRVFNFGFCVDELFVQTFMMTTDYHERRYHSPYQRELIAPFFTKNEEDCARLIDWNRGDPYTFTSENLDELQKTSLIFARKFDEKVDSEVIEKIVQRVKK